MLSLALFAGVAPIKSETEVIQKQKPVLKSDLMTPEAMWAMGRIGSYAASADGKKIVYQVSYYSVKQNKSHTVLYIIDANGGEPRLLTASAKSESDPAWLPDGRIAFLCGGEIWSMTSDGTDRRQLTKTDGKIEGYKFSPDAKRVMYIKQLPYHGAIEANPSDLPKATGRIVNDMNYRHWDHYVEEIPHPFIAQVNADGTVATQEKDILEGEPYECPAAPFGGAEQLAWSPDCKSIAYSCRKKEGVAYAISTDTDIFLYDIESGKTHNLCKPEGYKEPEIDATKSMKNQAVNAADNLKNNPGYDTSPQFSPDGKYITWLSMPRNGYESDRNRLCLYDLATGKKSYLTESFDSPVDDYCWASDNKTLYFLSVWHGQENLYRTTVKGEVKQLTDDWADFGSLQMIGSNVLAERHSLSAPADLYIINVKGVKGIEAGTSAKVTAKGASATAADQKASKAKTLAEPKQITFENKHILDRLTFGDCEQRWCATTDGKEEMYWIIKPPHFDPAKKYPTLLFCEGGPQSPVSQFWSYRWNFQIMAAHGYVVIAPNRHGLPGFGQKWLEEVSGDWTGQCMDDYLSAIDDASSNLSFVDKDRLAAVGASFGGYSVYWLAGHHNKRFKCFIAHDGAFNLESMYTDTEEAWFSNWEYEDAYWNKDLSTAAKKTYENSPHKFIDNWDTPILCIHGEKDYRINANQGFGAFNAARLKGVEAQLLIFPDENHWVLKPQNGILWQRTFFNWLSRWLKAN